MSQEQREFPLLDQIVRREAAIAQGYPSIRGLATTLLDHIIVSQSFSWVGLVDEQMPDGNKSVHFYLSEFAPGQDNQVLNELRSSIPDIFDDLALALEPDVVAELHITNEKNTPLSQLKSEIERYCGIDPSNRKLIWERSRGFTS